MLLSHSLRPLPNRSSSPRFMALSLCKKAKGAVKKLWTLALTFYSIIILWLARDGGCWSLCFGTVHHLDLCIYKRSMHIALNQTHLLSQISIQFIELLFLFPPNQTSDVIHTCPSAAHLYYCNLSILVCFRFSFNLSISLASAFL